MNGFNISAIFLLLWVLPKYFDILSIYALCWPTPLLFFGRLPLSPRPWGEVSTVIAGAPSASTARGEVGSAPLVA